MNRVPVLKERTLPILKGYTIICHSEDRIWYAKVSTENHHNEVGDLSASRSPMVLLTDEAGNRIKEFNAKKVRPFHEGVSWICFEDSEGNNWRLIDRKGEPLSLSEMPSRRRIINVRDFHDGVAWIKFDLKEDYFLINMLGEITTKQTSQAQDEYMLVTDFKDEHAWVKIRPKAPTVETHLQEPSVDSVEADKYVHLIDRRGRRILRFKQRDLPNFMDVAVAKDNPPKLQVILDGTEGDAEINDLLELRGTLANKDCPEEEVDMTPLTSESGVIGWVAKLIGVVQRAIEGATGLGTF